jgi:hypothetical protein
MSGSALSTSVRSSVIIGLVVVAAVFMLAVATAPVSADHTDDEYNYTVKLSSNEPDATGQTITLWGSPNMTADQVAELTLFVSAGPGAGEGASASFSFDQCGPDATTVFGVDRGGNNSGTTADDSWIPYLEDAPSRTEWIKAIMDTDRDTTGELSFYGRDRGDRIVTKSEDCLKLPGKAGWYQFASTYKGDGVSEYEEARGADIEGKPEGSHKGWTSHWIRIGDTENIGPNPSKPRTGSVTFEDQDAVNNTVTVSTIDLSHGGYLAVYTEEPSSAGPEDIVGTTSYLEHGSQDDVTIGLDESFTGEQTLYIVAHTDQRTVNDVSARYNKEFEYISSDGEHDKPYDGTNPYASDTGSIVSGSASVNFAGDEEAEEGGSAEFEVTNLDVPESVLETESYEVTATVTNVGNASGATSVEYTLDGEVLAEEALKLDADESQTLTIEVSDSDTSPGEYDHGITAGNDSATGTITIEENEEATFTVELEGPNAVQTGEEFVVDAVIQNGGDRENVVGVTIERDGETIVTEEPAIAPGESVNVTAFPTIEESGEVTFSVTAGGDSDELTVTVEDAEATGTDESGDDPSSQDGAGFTTITGLIAMILMTAAARLYRP